MRPQKSDKIPIIIVVAGSLFVILLILIARPSIRQTAVHDLEAVEHKAVEDVEYIEKSSEAFIQELKDMINDHHTEGGGAGPQQKAVKNDLTPLKSLNVLQLQRRAPRKEGNQNNDVNGVPDGDRRVFKINEAAAEPKYGYNEVMVVKQRLEQSEPNKWKEFDDRQKASYPDVRLPAIWNHTGSTTGELFVPKRFYVRPDGSQIDVSENGRVPNVFWSTLLVNKPRLGYLHGTLSPKQCADMIAIASKSIERSMVIDKDRGDKSDVNSVRTSYGMFMAKPEEANAEANLILRARGAAMMGLSDTSHIEATQILRYEAGQFYKPHMDFFDPWDHWNMDRGGQRIATILTWLNDVPEGGDTSFPNADVSVPPRQGDSVLFYSMNEDGTMSDFSQHGGVPPKTGSTKWVAVMWCHPREFR